MKKRKDWSHYDKDVIAYGHHKHGFGVYRSDPKTDAIVEWWPDYLNCFEEEITIHEEWLKSNGYRSEYPLKESLWKKCLRKLGFNSTRIFRRK